MGYDKKEKIKPLLKKQQDGKEIIIFHSKQTFRHQIDSSYYFAVRTGIEDACRSYGFEYLFHDIESLETFKPQNFKGGGIIVGNYPKDYYAGIKEKFPSAPLASIGIISWFPESIDHITHSNFEAIRLALEYLFENGHTLIGYIGVKEAHGTESFGSRKQYFTALMKEKGGYNAAWIYECEHGQDRVEQGYQMMKKWVSLKQALPTAIVCANDPVALGAIKALQEAGIAVPDKVSIIGHDGSFPVQYSLPGLTTVNVHPYQLGIEGVNALQERLSEGRKITKKIALYPELIIRDSVKQLTE
jgi:LacI family transcriptional regulator